MALAPHFGEIYVHTCMANEKSYVGQTTASMAKRWRLHVRCAQSPRTPAYCGLIARAIRKYGADAFEHQVLSVARSQAELDNLEKIWIILLQTKAPNGYNLADGGYAAAGHVVSPEVRALLSVKQTANWADPEYRAAHTGYRRTDESRAQMSQSASSRKVSTQTPEGIEKRAAKLRGTKRTSEFCAAQAARMTGIKLSEGTRLRMSLAQKARQERGRTNGA
jgi:group I intron endonuclease